MNEWWKSLPDETLVESAWERQMNVQGIEAFERSKYTASGNRSDASDTSAGLKTIRKLLLDSSKAIEEAQKSILNVRRVDRNLRGTVLLVPADTASMITLKCLIDRTYMATNPEDGATYQGVARTVSRAIETELNFRFWIKESQKAAKVYAETEGLAGIPKSQAERLLEEHGASRKQLNRWRETFNELNTYKWNTLAEHYCGDTLVTAVVEALPDTFEKYSLRRRGKETLMVRMTPQARKRFDDHEMKIASMSVVKKPMLTKPKRWTIA